MAKRSTKQKRRRRVLTFLTLGLLTVTIVALAYANAFLLSLPDVSYLAAENPDETALMRARGAERRQTWASLEDISPHLIRAVILAEDAAFYSHAGFDTHEIKEAFKRNWEAGRTVRGASTISQQLAKNLFLSTDRTYTRKLEEAFITYRLEKSLSKDRILEIYLNVIEWGDGVYGAEASARDLYRQSAKWLDPTQAATMAAMIPNPIRFHPCTSPTSLRPRRDRILRLMAATGSVSQAVLETASKRTPLVANCGQRR